MLIDNLYTVQKLGYQQNLLNATVKLDAENDIFKGHFPDVPVLPGVTMMQMVKELMEKGEGRDLLISKAGSLKFLQMINPTKNSILIVEIKVLEKTAETIRVKAQILTEETICFKMTAHLSIV